MELGSEYNLSLNQLNIVEDNLFKYLEEYNTIYTDSGRSAIKILSQNLGKVLLPEYVCESVLDCFDKSKVIFYKIDKAGHIDCQDILSKISVDVEAIFITHYFGGLQPQDTLQEVKQAADENNVIIIEDTTHSILSASQTIGDYMVASIRKWIPIALGGVLYSKKGLPSILGIEKAQDNTRIYGMLLKNLYLQGMLDCNTTYRKIFGECEARLDKQQEVKLMPDLSKFIISCVDLEELIKIRRVNYQYLSSKLKEIGMKSIFEIQADECPFVYPVRIDNRDAFRLYLMDNQIYCAVHWPFDGFQPEHRSMAVRNAATLISLPIDQRYGKEEMDYLIEVIKKYGSEQ